MSDFQVLVLAAGRSGRFGSVKQLADLHDKPLLQHVIDAVKELGRSPWICLGANAMEIMRSPELRLSDCEVVEVSNWANGLAESLKAGMETILRQHPDCEGVLVLLGDQPGVRHAQLRQMMAQVNQRPDTIIAAAYADQNGQMRGGVPAFFPASLFPNILSLQGERGAQQLIATQTRYLLELGKATTDVDYPEDLKAFVRDDLK